jgi:hypothetical protein
VTTLRRVAGRGRVRRRAERTIDADLARELDAGGNLSAQLNEAGWALLERRRRAERLAALLDELDHSDGPLAVDAAEDARLARLLGGAA